MGAFRVGASFGPRDFQRRGYRQAPAAISADHVYVIQGVGAVKIGVTSDLPGRLATLQTGSPHPLSLAYSTRVAGDAYAVEAEAHALLDRHRLSGEWFAVPPDVAVAAINGAAFRLSSSAIEDGRPPHAKWLKRFLWAAAFGLPFWVLTLSQSSILAPAYLIIPAVLLITAAARSRDSIGDIALWVFIAVLGGTAAVAPALLISKANAAESRPIIPVYDPADYCKKLTALIGDNPVVRDSCLSNQADAKKQLDRVWPQAPARVETDCIHLMEAGGQSNYAAVAGCLAMGVGNQWLRGELKLVPAE